MSDEQWKPPSSDPTPPPDHAPSPDPTPPPPPDGPPPPAAGRGRTVLIAVVAAVVILIGGGAAAAFLMMRGSSEQLVGLVPEQADVFATAYLDPSAGQKVNLLALARKFPDLGDEAELEGRVDNLLDMALEGSGLASEDVTPWLGSQIGVSVDLGDDGIPHAAALISTTDAEAARSAVEKLAAETSVERTEYDGVDIVTAASSNEWGAYAIVDDVLVFATDDTTVKRAIDAAHGTLGSLGEAAIYTETLSGLPEGKLGVAYVNVKGLVEQFGSETAASAALGAGGLGELESIESLGMSLSAESDGIALDITTNYDPAKLSPEQRQMLSAPDHDNTTMAFVPSDALGVLAGEHVDVSMQAMLDTIEEQTPDAAAAIDEAGVREFLEAMNGDIALEVGPGTDGPVSGALIVGADDPERMQEFLDTVGGLAAQALAQQAAATGTDDLLQQMEACQGTARQIRACQEEIFAEIDLSAQADAPGPLPTEEYEGVTITYLEEPSLAEVGVTPAYAVVDGAGVVATSPEEIRQLIDTEASGEDVRTATVYASATASVPVVESVFFLDIQAIADTVRENLPPDAQALYDEDVAPNLAPLTAFVVGGESDEERQTIRMFLQIT